MFAKYYKVYLEDGTESEEFVYSPTEAAECALICWMQQNPDEKPPKIVSIRALQKSFFEFAGSVSSMLTNEQRKKPYKGILTKKDKGE